MFKLNVNEFPVIGGAGEGRARGPVLRMKKAVKEAVGAVVKQGYKAKLAMRRKMEELEAKKALKDLEDKKKKEEKKEEEKRKKEAKKEKRRVLKEKADMARVLRMERRRAAKEEKEVVKRRIVMKDVEMAEVEVEPVETAELEEIEVEPVEMAEMDMAEVEEESVEMAEMAEVEVEPVEMAEMAEVEVEPVEMAELGEMEAEPVKVVEMGEMTADRGVETTISSDPRSVLKRKRRSGEPDLQALERSEDSVKDNGIPAAKKVRFSKTVLVQHQERVEDTSDRNYPLVVSGQDLGPVIQKRLKRFDPDQKGPDDDDLSSISGLEDLNLYFKSKYKSGNCSETCSELGCDPLECACQLDGVLCGDKFGCLCDERTCGNLDFAPRVRVSRRERINRTEAELAEMETPSQNNTIESVGSSPARSDVDEIESTRMSDTIESIAEPPARSPSPPPRRASAQLPPSGIDFDPALFSETMFQELLIRLDGTSACFAGEKWLVDDAVFFALLRDASAANRQGRKVAVMHPTAFIDWRNNRRCDKAGLEACVYYREDIETLLVPLHTGEDKSGHFSLAVLHAKDGRVTIYDSVEPTPEHRADVIGWLRGMFEELLPPALFAEVRIKYANRNLRDVQEDGFNCGVHTILHARRAAGGKRNLSTPKDAGVPVAEILRQIRRELETVMLIAQIECEAVMDANNGATRTIEPLIPCPPPPLNRGHRRY